MSAHHDVRFPFNLSLGAKASLKRQTEIVALKSGREERNSPWAHGRRMWDLGPAIQTRADALELISFFEARSGPLYSFRFRDPLDHSSHPTGGEPSDQDQVLGYGDGQRRQFAMTKRYGDGALVYARPITQLIESSLKVSVNDTSVSFTLLPGGVIELASAPAPGAAIRAGFEFDVPVRFESDQLDLLMDHPGQIQAGQIRLIEVRL